MKKVPELDLSRTSIEHIDESAFNNWWNPSVLKFPKTLKEIGAKAFRYWNQGSGKRTTVYIPMGCEIIATNAFDTAKNIDFLVPWSSTDGKAPTSTTQGSTCTYDTYLMSLDTPDLFAEEMCAKLNSNPYDLHVPDRFKTVPVKICHGDKLVRNVYIPKGTTAIGEYAFYQLSETSNPNLTVSIPEGVESIGQYAFYRYPQSSLKLPDTLRFIGRYAFAFSKLSKIDIPVAVSEIGAYAFNSMTSVPFHIPMGVNSIGAEAFKNCTFASAPSGGLPWFRIHGYPNIASDALTGVKTTHNQTLVIYVPWSESEDETYGLTSKPWGFEGTYQIVRAAGNR